MSQILKRIFGAFAVSLTFGAVQFASGHDLVGRQAVANTPETSAPETGINRAAKADRAAVPVSHVQTRTIALRLDSLTEISVLIRVPEESRARPARLLLRSVKAAIACEPVVSVLTELAKELQPGRCVT
jgi:hypothetical protein